MQTYLIERTVPGAGQMDAPALAAISGHSNDVLAMLGPDIACPSAAATGS